MRANYCTEKQAQNARVARAPSPAAVDFEFALDFEFAPDFELAFDFHFTLDLGFALGRKVKSGGRGRPPHTQSVPTFGLGCSTL